MTVRRRLRCTGLVVLLTLSLGAVYSRARAETGAQPDPVAAAEQYAEQAFQAYTSKDYARAVSLYRQAYDAAPSADILYNIARIYDVGLRDRPLAITFYRRYAADPGAVPERIVTANQRLVQLRDAEEAAAGTSSPAPAQRTVAPPEPPVERAAPSVGQRQPPDTGARLRQAGWITGVLGVATLAMGGGVGIAAMLDADSAKQDCDGDACRTQAGVDAAEAGTRKATAATIGFIAGGVLTATGLTLWLVGNNRSGERARAASVTWVPTASASTVGAALSGRW